MAASDLHLVTCRDEGRTGTVTVVGVFSSPAAACAAIRTDVADVTRVMVDLADAATGWTDQGYRWTITPLPLDAVCRHVQIG